MAGSGACDDLAHVRGLLATHKHLTNNVLDVVAALNASG